MQPSFTLTEQFAFGSQYTWRLKESEIRFRGSGDFERLVMRRIPASQDQIDSFFSALDLIQVWMWRADYNPNDAGYEVDDGSSWSFAASFGSRQCHCGGVNAFPSFADPKQTSLDRGRFSLLTAAMYVCFEIDSYVDEAKRIAATLPPQRDESAGGADPGGVAQLGAGLRPRPPPDRRSHPDQATP